MRLISLAGALRAAGVLLLAYRSAGDAKRYLLDQLMGPTQKRSGALALPVTLAAQSLKNCFQLLRLSL